MFCLSLICIFKTGPEAEPNNFWVTVQYGSTESNLVQYSGLIYFLCVNLKVMLVNMIHN